MYLKECIAMNKVKGINVDSAMTVNINLTEYGYGWIKLNIPIENRAKILMELDVELEAYKSNPQWREHLGGRIVDWLKYTVDPKKYE